MRAALKDSALELGPELPAGSFALAVGGDDLGLLPLSMDEAGNGVLVAGPRRSGRSTALYFATSTALSGGAHVVLVLPRRSPLAGLSGHPGVLGILDTTAKPDDLKDLLRSYGPETLIARVVQGAGLSSMPLLTCTPRQTNSLRQILTSLPRLSKLYPKDSSTIRRTHLT